MRFPFGRKARTRSLGFCRPGPEPEIRWCAHKGCITPLSSYHEDADLCYIHEGVPAPEPTDLAELMVEVPGA